MLSLIGFIAALGPLVVFHELGHFLFAKLFGVRAEAFSVGFGPKLWSRTYGETEWKISAIPLGGYVKLLGEEPGREIPPEDQNRTLQSKPAWQRFFIFFGGPLFNFVLAVFIFMAIFVIGDEQPASVVGRVLRNSPAYEAGLRSGDRITTVNGTEVKRYQDFDRVLSEHPGESVNLTLLRGTETRNLSVKLGSREGFSQYGEVRAVGDLDGVGPFARSLKVGVSDPQSRAGMLGIKTGDLIKNVAVNGNPAAVTNFEDLDHIYWNSPVGSLLALEVESAGKSLKLEFKKAEQESLSQATGLYSSEMFVDQVMKSSPAEAAGMKSGDRLVAVNGVEPLTFMELREQIQKSAEQTGKVPMVWEREGKIIKSEILPTMSETVDPILRKSKQFTVGVVPMLEFSVGPMVIERILNPFTLIGRSFTRMVELSENNLVSIGKLLRGDVSIGVMGGPISIGKIAGDSLSRGLIAFLTTMAMLSVGLGVLNLLPVPVLDGGHIVLLGIEAIRRKPLSIRQLEIVQQVGLSLILLLMVVVIRNDIARLPFFK